MFNLNDGRWGRGDEPSSNGDRPNANRPDEDAGPSGNNNNNSNNNNRPRGQGQGPNQGPPDLDELWRDFNRKLGGLFGGGRGGNGGRPTGGNGGGNGMKPDMKNAGVGLGLVAAVAVLIWLGTGFFIVNEGQQGVITQFGRYKATVGAGFNWRLPYPIQRHEIVVVTQIRSIDVGRDTIVRSTGLRDSAMLTEDENIVEIKFAVQYRLSDARAYLYESKTPTDAVVQVAETAVREVVGKMKMDAALAEERDQIAPRVRALMQNILDRYKVGIEVVGINVQQGGLRPPEQVQAAFDDVLKAGQERERTKNEAQAYANDVVPRATGTASRLLEESEAYKARITAQAQGDAQRFSSVLAEYQRAPQVTRDRMYTDAMQQIYTNTTKVLVDSKQGSNLLYLPLDKLIQGAGPGGAGAPVDGATPNVAGTAPPQSSVIPVAPVESRARDGRSRDRDVR
ncbi:FtsH protease activity modulator HflK [Variovorax sp. KK3]|uniref:FtsH protease activity modulator HflK n=1 Tax=Variovorax sp. KK3 TaxID=1855728 RepID=UPI00097C65CE|nr:FtsH protease activity modulator HflK [Variovorax sp. KK3]